MSSESQKQISWLLEYLPNYFLEYPIKQKVTKSIRISGYPIKIVDVMDIVVLPNMNFTNTQLKNTNTQYSYLSMVIT